MRGHRFDRERHGRGGSSVVFVNLHKGGELPERRRSGALVVERSVVAHHSLNLLRSGGDLRERVGGRGDFVELGVISELVVVGGRFARVAVVLGRGRSSCN